MKCLVIKILESVIFASFFLHSRLFSSCLTVYVCRYVHCCSPCDFGLSSLTAPQTWGGGGVLERGSDRGVEKRGWRVYVCELNQREPSLIAVAHLLMELMKNGSKPNALRWKKFHHTALGRFSLSPHTHLNTNLHTNHLSALSQVPLLSRSVTFQHLLTQNPLFLSLLAPICTFCYFHTLFSTLPLSHKHTCTLSLPVLFPYVSLFTLIKCAGPSLASLLFPGEKTNCDTTVFAW